MSTVVPTYRIHPGIGIARLGDSPDAFCISPERPASLPIECDELGNPRHAPDGRAETPIAKFKDEEGRIKRQAARFHIYVYDEEHPKGRPLRIGDKVKGGGNHGVLVDVLWQVYLANKKSSWYEFDQLAGEHGYSASHKRRNADITGAARDALIIDPGPRVINATNRRRATFGRDGQSVYAPTFPPPLTPRSIDTLGEILTDDAGRLLVLGGFGNSGTMNSGFGQPRIDSYANNDGWFDDTSDGVVMARLVIYSEEVDSQRYIDVEYPAWVIVGSPAYVPEILNLVTMEDVLEDLSIREFATRTDLYGAAGTFADPQHVEASDPEALRLWKRGRLEWNGEHKPWFYRDVWPILFRADEYMHLTNVLEQSNFPHNQTERGNFDPAKLSRPPVLNLRAWNEARALASARNQAGTLVAEALEPTLTMLDDEFRQHAGGRAAGFARALDADDVRRALTAAAAEFAAAVYPEGDDRQGDDYLEGWQAAYRRAEQDSKDDEYRAVYDAAKRRLADQANAAVETIAQSVAANSGLGPPAVRAALARRMPAAGPADRDTPKPAGDAVDMALKRFRTGNLLEAQFESARESSTYDPYRIYRAYLFELLRMPGEENLFRAGTRPNSRTFNLPLMPLLCGDNPISNATPSKFLRLTDYQYYTIRQWASGAFYNEVSEGWVDPKDVDLYQPYNQIKIEGGADLDRAALANLVGGALCPGGEVGWIMRNPSIYREPFRIKADPDFYAFRQTAAQANQTHTPPDEYVASISTSLSQDSDYAVGLQPGDLTKQLSVPWQSDFNECSTNVVDVTYERWNSIDPDEPNDPRMQSESQLWETLWWPAHRPMQTWEVVGVSNGAPQFQYLNWSRGVPQTLVGDLKMVTEWVRLGFVVRNPYLSDESLDKPSVDLKYISVERAPDDQ